MTTPRLRSLVSLAAALTLTLGVGGCAAGPARLAVDDPAPANPAPAVHFENTSLDYVRVYLVGLRREWPLGRVAPGANATLRIPEDALAEDEGGMRLAVLVGDRATRRIGGDANAMMPLERPMAEIVAQRWTFTQRPTYGELTALPLGPVRSASGRP